jgi:hypothetical protein
MAEKLQLPEIKGLRLKAEHLYQPAFLADCKNIIMSESGLFEAEKFTKTFEIYEDAQILPTRIGTFVATANTIYEYADDELLARQEGITENGRWSCADFGQYLVFSNGLTSIVRDPATGLMGKDEVSVPVSNAVGAHRGRLMLVSSASYAEEILDISDQQLPESDTAKHIHNNFVTYTIPGELKLPDHRSPDRTNMSGYMPMEFSGKLYRGEPLKSHWIIYGENGIGAMSLAGSGKYSMTTIHRAGIIDEWAVCMNGILDGATIHYFIDTTGDMYMLTADLSLTKIGYKEFLKDTPARMSYDVKRNEVLINFNNNETFVYGANGLTKISGDIQDVSEKDGETLVHAPSVITQADLSVTTNIINMGTNCQKYFHGFSANIMSPEEVKVIVYYRTHRNAGWEATDLTVFDKNLSYFNAGRISGIEFYIEFSAEDYSAFQLSDIVIHYSKLGGGLQDG